VDFWDEVTVIPAVTSVDGLGTPLKLPGDDGPTVPAIVQQEISTEQTASGQSVATNWRIFLPYDAPVDAFAMVRWNGVLYEVDGEPARFDGPTGPHHTEARLRKVR